MKPGCQGVVQAPGSCTMEEDRCDRGVVDPKLSHRKDPTGTA